MCKILIQEKFRSKSIFVVGIHIRIMYLNSFNNYSVFSSQSWKNPAIRGKRQHHQYGCLKACGNFFQNLLPGTLWTTVNIMNPKRDKTLPQRLPDNIVLI